MILQLIKQIRKYNRQCPTVISIVSVWAPVGDLLLAEPGAGPVAHPGEEGERGGGPHPRHSQARQEIPRHRQVSNTQREREGTRGTTP